MAKYKVESGETLWNIAKQTMPGDTKKAVVAIFERNWEPLARRFWLPADVELDMPDDFEPSGNVPFDPSANKQS